MSNVNLNLSQITKNDEFYTQIEDICKELPHYVSQLHDKIVLCPCNDGLSSNFIRYLAAHFYDLQLKKLIGITSVPRPQLIQITPSNNSTLSVVQTTIKSGDFRDCEKYIQNCDIIITNPPFSLFRELFNLIQKHNKKFLLVSNLMSLTYKDVFPFIKRGEVRTGYNSGTMSFLTPINTTQSLRNIIWLTNLQVEPKPLWNLHKNYDSLKYPKYDGQDVIHVSNIKDIPVDYFGVMGVSVNFLTKHNPNQFEIIGEANHGSDNEYDLFEPKLYNKLQFKRILIQRK